MSYVIAAPGQVAAAAADLGDLGSTISSANSTAMGLASSVTPPGADEVSASVAAMFDAHAQAYQLLSAQAAAFHDQFVQLVNSGATQYALTEAANASPLQTADHGVVSTAVNQSGQALTHAQPVMNAATPAGSAAAAVPSATASLAGGTAPAAPVAPLTSAVAPPPAAAAPITPLTAVPAASAVPTAAPAAPMQAPSPPMPRRRPPGRRRLPGRPTYRWRSAPRRRCRRKRPRSRRRRCRRCLSALARRWRQRPRRPTPRPPRRILRPRPPRPPLARKQRWRPRPRRTGAPRGNDPRALRSHRPAAPRHTGRGRARPVTDDSG